MSDPLEQLRPELDALEGVTLSPPRLAPLVALGEARALVEMLQQTLELWEPLRELGVDEDLLEHLELVIAGAELAQRRLLERRREFGQIELGELGELAREGIRLRAQIITAARYHLRDVPHLVEELEAVQEGEGAADLVLDLDTLARFLKARRRAFAADERFDAPACAERARAIARELRARMHELDDDTPRQRARELRDRAFHLLSQCVFEIRAAGRYRFWDDEARPAVSGARRAPVSAPRRSAGHRAQLGDRQPQKVAVSRGVRGAHSRSSPGGVITLRWRSQKR